MFNTNAIIRIQYSSEIISLSIYSGKLLKCLNGKFADIISGAFSSFCFAIINTAIRLNIVNEVVLKKFLDLLT